MNTDLNADYWERRYREGQTGWDLGGPNVELVSVLTTYLDSKSRILIPGAGRGHEAEALWRLGYCDVFVCDWAPEAFGHLKKSPYLPDADRLIVANFFDLRSTYDAILEQTFFCAIDPAQRDRYVQQAAALLRPGGRWIGVLFDRSFEGGPPFGGTEREYRRLFSSVFDIELLGRFDGSIRPRRGRELLGLMTKLGTA